MLDVTVAWPSTDGNLMKRLESEAVLQLFCSCCVSKVYTCQKSVWQYVWFPAVAKLECITNCTILLSLGGHIQGLSELLEVTFHYNSLCGRKMECHHQRHRLGSWTKFRCNSNNLVLYKITIMLTVKLGVSGIVCLARDPCFEVHVIR